MSLDAWDGRLRARLAVLGLALFVYLTAEMFPVGALPEISTGLGVRESTTGLLLSGYAVAAGLAALPVVAWLRSRDRRTMLAGAMILLAGSQVALALAPTFEAAILSRVVAAVAHGYVWSVVPVVASMLAPEGSRGRATATVFVGSVAGLVVGSPVSAALSQGVGWRGAAAVLAGLAAGVAVLLRTVLPALPPGPTRRPGAGEASAPMRRRSVLALCGVTAVAAAAHNVSYPFLAVLVDPLGIDAGRYAVLLAAYGVAGLVGVRLVGRFVDRAARTTGIVLFAVLAASLGALGPALAGGAMVPAVVLLVLWAAAFSAAPAVLQDAVLRAAPDHGDTASAAYVVAFQVGIATGSALGAGMLGPLDGTGLPVVSALLAVVALALFVLRPDAGRAA